MHFRKDYSERKRKGKKKTSDSGNVAGVAEDSGGDVLSITDGSLAGDWILNLGCTYHIFPNREWFTTYQSINGGKILMGNNAACKLVGIGSIRIKMHYGIMRTLTDARHAPDLRKNMISLGTLDSNSYTYKAEGGVLKVLKSALVGMKGLRKNGIYLL